MLFWYHQKMKENNNTHKKKNRNNNGWTPERRLKQAETIRKNKPWEKSTGPRTVEGKRRSSLNALMDGQTSAFYVEYQKMLKLNRDFCYYAKMFMMLDDGSQTRLAMMKAILNEKTQKKELKEFQKFVKQNQYYKALVGEGDPSVN